MNWFRPTTATLIDKTDATTTHETKQKEARLMVNMTMKPANGTNNKSQQQPPPVCQLDSQQSGRRVDERKLDKSCR